MAPFVRSLPALVLAAVLCLYVLLLSLIYRSLSPSDLYQVLVQTARTTGSIILIVAAASLFGWVIAREEGPQRLAAVLLAITDNPYVFLLVINLALLLIGMLLEPVAALLITVPVLLPVAHEFGIDPLHLGIVMILNLVIGLLAPPGGIGPLRPGIRDRQFDSRGDARNPAISLSVGRHLADRHLHPRRQSLAAKRLGNVDTLAFTTDSPRPRQIRAYRRFMALP